MRRHTLGNVCGTLSLLAFLTSIASTGRGGEGCWFHCCFCNDKICVTSVRPTQQKEDDWDVECTDVCIPAVRFPWDARPTVGCDGMGGSLLPKYGKVRSVRKLKKVEKERDVCEYEHKIIGRCPNGRTNPGTACVSDQSR